MTKYDIYLIWGKDQEGNILRYYGSTSNFIKRKSHHKNNYKKWLEEGRPNNKKCSAFHILDNGDWKMEKIDEIDGDRWQARKLEGEYQKNNDCVNVRKENRTGKEWRTDNTDILKEKKKEYYNLNKDEILQLKKKYYNDNKANINERKKEYYNLNKVEIAKKRKENYNLNKDEIAKKKKENYNLNKDKILEKQKEKIKCECGSEIRKNDLARHNRSKKHINFINSN